MHRSSWLVALVLGGMLAGTGTVAAQSSRGEKALSKYDYDKAIVEFKAQTGNPKSKNWCGDMFQLAYSHYMAGQYPEAIAVIDELLAKADRPGCATSETVPAWHYWRGRAAYDDGQFKESADSFARAAEIAPTALPPGSRSPWALTGLQPVKVSCFSYLAGARYHSGEFQAAAAARRKAIELNPKDKWEYAGLAQALVGQRSYDEALAAARRALDLGPEWALYRILGQVFQARGQYADAIDAFNKALADNAKVQELYVALGEAQFLAGDYDGALATYAKAQEVVPGDMDFFFQPGVIHARLGKFDDALPPLDSAIARLSHPNLGVSFHFIDGVLTVGRQAPGDPGVTGAAREAGLKAGDRIVEINGQPTKGWTAQSDAFIKSLAGEEGTSIVLTIKTRGEASPSKKTLVKKIQPPPAEARFFGLRSLVHREKGNREAAVKDAEQCLALDPANAYGLQAMGALDLDAGKYDAAIARLSRLNDNPFARLVEATAYARKGEAPKAAEIYAAIPESQLTETSALRQSARAVLLRSLQGYAQASLDKARSEEAAGRLAEALRDYAGAMTLSDEPTAALVRQRVAILLKANPPLAELPEEARKYALRGDVLIKDGSFAEALTQYRLALKIAPFNPQLHFNAALIHGQLRSYPDAIRSMNTYLQLSPDAANARSARDEIYKWEFSLEKAGKK